jgi:hypothetical protein
MRIQYQQGSFFVPTRWDCANLVSVDAHDHLCYKPAGSFFWRLVMRGLPILMVCPLFAGCVAFGYPSLTYTPGVSALDSEVHAFKSTFECGGRSYIMTGGETISLTKEEIPIHGGRLEPQEKSYFAYFVGGIPVAYSRQCSWSVLLYRPGFEVIEIPSHWWGRRLAEPELEKLNWKPASDLDAQVHALEMICGSLRLASLSADVRQFAASEYERLANGPLVTTPEVRESLLAKANALRKEQH